MVGSICTTFELGKEFLVRPGETVFSDCFSIMLTREGWESLEEGYDFPFFEFVISEPSGIKEQLSIFELEARDIGDPLGMMDRGDYRIAILGRVKGEPQALRMRVRKLSDEVYDFELGREFALFQKTMGRCGKMSMTFYNAIMRRIFQI